MDKQKFIHIVSFIVAIVGVILANGEQWFSIPGIPPWLAHSWPTVLFIATAIDRLGVYIINYFSTGTSTKLTILAIGLIGICISTLQSGCATNTGDPVKDARGRATNQALVEAAKVLGNFAVVSLQNAAQQEMQNGKVDWGNAATTGLYANSTSILNSGQIERVINAYAGNNLPQTAQAAATAFDSSNANPDAKTQAIAAVISTAAGAPPANVQLHDLAFK